MYGRWNLVVVPLLVSCLLLGLVFVQPASSSITVDANLEADSIDVVKQVNDIIIPFNSLFINLDGVQNTDKPVKVKFEVTTEKTDTVYTETQKYESSTSTELNISHIVISPNLTKEAFPVAGESTKATISVKATHPDVDSDIVSKELTISRNIDNTSCKSILNSNQDASSSTYTINPSGSQIDVYCDMDTRGGGWTKINASIARSMVNNNGGGLEAKQGTFGSGLDGDRPYFQSRSSSGGGMEYDIKTGFEFDQIYLENVGFESTSDKSGSGDTSEYDASKYTMDNWEYRGGRVDGDIGFGVASDSGPTTTYTDNGGSFESNSGVADFPFNIDTSNGRVFDTGTSDSTLRIAASESGPQDEGWRWERGSIYVR